MQLIHFVLWMKVAVIHFDVNTQRLLISFSVLSPAGLITEIELRFEQHKLNLTLLCRDGSRRDLKSIPQQSPTVPNHKPDQVKIFLGLKCCSLKYVWFESVLS